MKSSNFNQKVYDISEHIQRDFFWCIVKDRMPKKVNYSRVPNKFITYVYTIDIPTMGSHRDNVFRVYVIHSNCARLHNFFFFMMEYGENGYLHSKMWTKMTEN